MTSREIIFEGIPGSRVAGRELHVTFGDNQCVEWRVVPRGEQGRSLPFKSSQAAEHFVQNYARRLGFARRLEDTNSEFPT